MPVFNAPRQSRLDAAHARLADDAAPWLELARGRMLYALDAFAAWLVALTAAGPVPRIWIAAETAVFPASCPGCGGQAAVPYACRTVYERELKISLCDDCAFRLRQNFHPRVFIVPLLRIGLVCLIWVVLSLPFTWQLHHWIGPGLVNFLALFPILFTIREALHFYRFRMAQRPLRIIPHDTGPSLEVAARNGAWLAELARMNEETASQLL